MKKDTCRRSKQEPFYTSAIAHHIKLLKTTTAQRTWQSILVVLDVCHEENWTEYAADKGAPLNSDKLNTLYYFNIIIHNDLNNNIQYIQTVWIYVQPHIIILIQPLTVLKIIHIFFRYFLNKRKRAQIFPRNTS